MDTTARSSEAAPAHQFVNHWGRWVDSEQPVTGVLDFNKAPEWIFDLEAQGINLTCYSCTRKGHEGACDSCEPYGPVLIGSWKRTRPNRGPYVWGPDKTGEFAAICREDVIQVVYSIKTKRGALCSPCYPGQVDLDSPGDFLGYCLPD